MYPLAPGLRIHMGEHATLLLCALVTPDIGCDKWVLTGRGILCRVRVDLPLVTTPHFCMTNTRVVGVPPLVIPPL